jgi:hypothetical protein
MAGAVTLSLLGMQAGPAAAARRWSPFPWADLIGDRPRKPRGIIHSVAIPLPRSRPAEAPAARPNRPEKPQPAEATKGADKPADQAAPVPQPSACRQALTEAIAIAPSIPDIRGADGCGGEDLVRLEAIVLPDKRQVVVKPAAILRCNMAATVADWIRSDIAPLAQRLGTQISDLDNFDSFECRSRNGIAGAQLSEHGRANALDLHAFNLANGRSISLTDPSVPRDLREDALHSACARFSTVLGPGSDGYHEDHIHLDLMERRNNYRICQWDIWDALPPIAPLLPAERPEQAPPREVAATSGAAKTAQPDQVKQAEAKAGAAEPRADTSPRPTKKRRKYRRPSISHRSI